MLRTSNTYVVAFVDLSLASTSHTGDASAFSLLRRRLRIRGTRMQSILGRPNHDNKPKLPLVASEVQPISNLLLKWTWTGSRMQLAEKKHLNRDPASKFNFGLDEPFRGHLVQLDSNAAKLPTDLAAAIAAGR
jgi:hypothetical protein